MDRKKEEEKKLIKVTLEFKDVRKNDRNKNSITLS